MASEAPQGVHLVGSTPYASAEEHFRETSQILSHHLRSLTDGETGPQGNWIGCQYPLFAGLPKILNWGQWLFPANEESSKPVPLEDIPAMIGDFDVMYDTWALKSWQEFKKLRDEGVIPKHVKFQVCLPTPLSNMVFYINLPYRSTVEPIYETALLKALRRIQDNIPHEDLLIQWDVVQEIALLENVAHMENAYGLTPQSGAWFEPVVEGTIERLLRMLSHVDKDVAMGMHLCYGDYGHKHFLEPPSTDKVAQIIKTVLTEQDHPLEYFQFPVAKARNDEAYYGGIKGIWPLIEQKGTYVYVGLIHPNDDQGTKEKLAAAKKALGSSGWGIAAECGIGREPVEGAVNIMETSKIAAKPWSA